MFEILSTAELTVSASIVASFLALTLARTAAGRFAVLGALGAWFVLVLAIGATAALNPKTGLGVPGLGLSVALPVVALVWAYAAVPAMRTAAAATPLPALIAVHVIRLLGVNFLILYAANRLPAPFAPTAGWGDIFIGATAAPLAWAIARFGAPLRALALLWNALGTADLIAAVALGALSPPGPPDSSLMTTLPWFIIPGFLVPCLMFLHVVIFARLTKSEGMAPAHAWLTAGPAKTS